MRLFFYILLFSLTNCTPTTVIEPVLPPPEVVDLGFLPAIIDKEAYTPYFDLRNLIFETTDGESHSLGDKTFYEVSYAKQELGDRFLEVYYSTEKGIIAFGTSYLFAILDRAY